MEELRVVPGLWDVHWVVVPPPLQGRLAPHPQAVSRGLRVKALPGLARGVLVPVCVSAFWPTYLRPGEPLIKVEAAPALDRA